MFLEGVPTFHIVFCLALVALIQFGEMTLKEIKHLILDMDGVLWHGNRPVPGLPDFFEQLKAMQISWAFATNNSSKTLDQYVTKFAGMDVDIDPNQVMTSAVATGFYMQDAFPAGSNVYVLGADGLVESMSKAGFNVLARDDYQTPAAAVVAGLNPGVTYEDLSISALHILNHGAKLIASNMDSTYPSERGLLPGAGALISVIETATEQTAVVVGKPYPIMFQQALKMFGDGATLQNTAMVGDRLNTDIAGAVGVDMRSILVMSGITQPADLAASEIQPDFAFSGILELAAELKKAKG